MPRTEPFDTHGERYEDWFERHLAAYQSELLALRAFVPIEGRGLEVGVGSARFAAPLGVATGIDPSMAMLARARARGIEVVAACAEALPFCAASFDHVLIVTTLCFVDAPAKMLAEAHRVLACGGRIVIGFVDRDSPIGQDYLAHQHESVFYRDASFYSAAEVEDLLRAAGFRIEGWGQTLSRPLAEITQIEALQTGRGRGAFLVVAAAKGDPPV